MSSARLRWLEAFSSALGLACYVSLYAPWFILAQTEMGVPLLAGYGRLSLLLLVAYATARLGHAGLERLSSRVRYQLTIGWGLAGVAFTLWGVVLPLQGSGVHYVWWLLLGLAAWVRGLHMGIYPAQSVDMQRQMVLGALGLALVMLLAHQWGQWEIVLAEAAPFLLFWLIGVLVATGLLHLQEMGERASGQSGSLARFWPPLLLSLASVLLGLAVVFSWLAPVLIQVLRWPARLIWYGFQTVVGVIGYGLGYVVQVLVWILRRLLSPGEPIEFEAPEAFGPGELVVDEIAGTSPLVMESLKWLGLAAVVLGAVALAVYLLLRQWQRPKEGAPQEVRESYASLSALRGWGTVRWQELLREMERRGRRWRRRRPPASPVEIYHALLTLARERDLPRHPAVTPHEFCTPLKKCFPGNDESIEEFSGAFLQEYYGERSPSAEVLRQLQDAWQAFRSSVKEEEKGQG